MVRNIALRSSNAVPFADSPRRWYLRGFAIGMMWMAAINAISYFIRSQDWSGLVGRPLTMDSSLGFPLVIWEAGNAYRGWFVDYPRLGANLLVAAGVGAVVGWWTARRSDRWNHLIQQLQLASAEHPHQPIQFSLRGLLVATSIIALITALARNYAVRAEVLVAIYLLGPLLLVAIAMLPRRLAWQKRVAIIIPAALSLIAVAMAVGVALGMEFDKVLMGIFLSWTPQSVLAAVGLTVWILIGQTDHNLPTRNADG